MRIWKNTRLRTNDNFKPVHILRDRDCQIFVQIDWTRSFVDFSERGTHQEWVWFPLLISRVWELFTERRRRGGKGGRTVVLPTVNVVPGHRYSLTARPSCVQGFSFHSRTQEAWGHEGMRQEYPGALERDRCAPPPPTPYLMAKHYGV